jgi:AraC-like DNA-binding protein
MAPLFLSRLEGRDAELAGLIAEHSLPDDAPRVDQLALPLSRFRALAADVAELLGDPLLGLHTATSLRPGTYGIIEFLLRSAATPRVALRQLLRFVPLFNNLLQFSLVENDDTAVLEGWIPGEPQCLGREGNEFALAVFVTFGRQLAGEGWAPEHVSFAHPRPGGVDELTRFFRCPISFGTGYVGLRIRAPDLERSVLTGDDALHEFLERQARALTSDVASDELDLARDAIRTALRAGEPTVADVARALGTSQRTLQRRLTERDTSFRAMVDQVREGLAREYLGQRDRSLKEVATLLGYADARAFGRAYKRWTGRSPGG